MKVASRKNKGKRLENRVASLWRSKMQDMAVRTPGSGSGTKFKEDVYTRYYSIECKNNERHDIWREWGQAVAEHHLAKPPVLCISANHRPILAIMDINEWLNLVKEAKYEK